MIPMIYERIMLNILLDLLLLTIVEARIAAKFLRKKTLLLLQ